MRRIPVLLAVALMLTSFVGCAASEAPADSTESSQTLSGETPETESPAITQKEYKKRMTRHNFSDFQNVELIDADLDGMSDEQPAV